MYNASNRIVLGQVLRSNISRRVVGLPARSSFGSPLSSFVSCVKDKQKNIRLRVRHDY